MRLLVYAVFFVLYYGLVSCACYDLGYEQMNGPTSRDDFQAWITKLRDYREKEIIAIGFNDTFYDIPQIQWTQKAFIQPQMMSHERYFYDTTTRAYTVDKYLDDLNDRYGGIDAVLIWPTYPNIGTDDRNQYDLIRSMPGYPDKLRDAVNQFHSHGVRVLFPYNPWDKGTREEGVPDWVATAQVLKEINADGFNGDTMGDIPEDFFQQGIKEGHPIVLEAEDQGKPSINLIWQTYGWGYWSYPTIPCVSTLKWIARKHVTNVCNRWSTDHTDDLQFAFFNGVGYESWENVWGIWNQMVPRDAQALKRIASILRFFGTDFTTQKWTPHTPEVIQDMIFASKFQTSNASIWTIVNRSSKNMTGDQLRIKREGNTRYFDVYHGVELQPKQDGENYILSFDIEDNGFGAVYATSTPISNTFTSFLSTMKDLTRHALGYYSKEWTVLEQKMIPILPTPGVLSEPTGMIKIPSGQFNFTVKGIEIEGYYPKGVDFQYPWEYYPRRQHSNTMTVKEFFIDKYPVTNKNFETFLKQTKYQPEDKKNYLRDWNENNGSFPLGWDNKPVTWISLEEANLYCISRTPKARLPNEWEWQYAAQGLDGRIYPWGNTWTPSNVPVPDKGGKMRGPDDVDAHIEGASPFGVMDMTGNVYHWTNKFCDEHTCAAVIRGGNYYTPLGSSWYQPQSYSLLEHTKYLLMSPSLDRSGGIGFRCVVDSN